MPNVVNWIVGVLWLAALIVTPWVMTNGMVGVYVAYMTTLCVGTLMVARHRNPPAYS